MYVVYQYMPLYCQQTTCSGSWYIPVIEKNMPEEKVRNVVFSVDSVITFLFVKFTGVNMHVFVSFDSI